MKVYIPSPGSGAIRTYEVTPETTIRALAKMITEREGIPFPGSGYAIRYAGKNVSRDPRRTLQNHMIGNESTLYLTSKNNMNNNNSLWNGDGGKRKTRRNRNRRNMTRRRR